MGVIVGLPGHAHVLRSAHRAAPPAPPARVGPAARRQARGLPGRHPQACQPCCAT
jgi:hypothetical protein